MIHTPYFLKQGQKKPFQTRVRNTIPTFLIKTYEMLENKEHMDIVCWSDNGKSFMIKKHNEFRDQVLPQYFKHNNFSSFVRQLNMYDFHKVRSEGTDSEYKNPQFIQGQQQLMSEIKRKSGENYFQEEFSNNFQPSENQYEKSEKPSELHDTRFQNNPSIILDPELDLLDNQMDSGSIPNNNNNNNNISLANEIMNFKQKQNNLEKAMLMLIKQHETLIKENKMLWDEIRKQVEIDENKSNQLIMVLGFYLSNFNQSAHNTSQNNSQYSHSNNGSTGNNTRALSIQKQNRKYQMPSDDFDLAKIIQTAKQYMGNNDISKGMEETTSMRTNNAGVFTSETQRGQHGKPVFPMTFKKKGYSDNLNQDSVTTQQIQKLFESYSSGDNQNKEKITSYLQDIINNSKNSENNKTQRGNYQQIQKSHRQEQKQNHEQQSLSVFENPCGKKIFGEQIVNKMLPGSEITGLTSDTSIFDQKNNNSFLLNANSLNDLSMQTKQQLNQFVNEPTAIAAPAVTQSVFASNEYLMDTLLNNSRNPTNQLNNSFISNRDIFQLNKDNTSTTNIFNNINIPLFNDAKYFSDLSFDQQLLKYSPSPVRSHDGDNNNILFSPNYFTHGPSTPVHNYNNNNNEEDLFFINSRKNSFHLPDTSKQQDSQGISNNNNNQMALLHN